MNPFENYESWRAIALHELLELTGFVTSGEVYGRDDFLECLEAIARRMKDVTESSGLSQSSNALELSPESAAARTRLHQWAEAHPHAAIARDIRAVLSDVRQAESSNALELSRPKPVERPIWASEPKCNHLG